MRKLLIILIAICLLPSVALAATHYICRNTEGQGDTSGDSWANCSDGLDDMPTLSANDVVELDGGSSGLTWTSESYTFSTSGTLGNVITIMKSDDTGHDGDITLDGNSDTSKAFYGNGPDYITLNGTGISVTGYTSSEGSIEFRNITGGTVKNFTIDNSLGRGIRFWTHADTLIQNNTISHPVMTSSVQNDSIYVQTGTDTVIDGNTCTVRNNHNTPHADALQTVNETRLTIKNNYLAFADGGGNADSQIIIETSNVWVKAYNNVVIGAEDQQYQSFLFDQKDGNETAGEIYVWNNVIVDQYSGGGYNLRIANFNSSYVKAVKNNVLINSDGRCLHIDSESGDIPEGAVDYNILDCSGTVSHMDGSTLNWTGHQAAGYDANGYNEDSSLDSDYKPDAGDDPSVDTGVDLSSSFTTDKDGITREDWDIGAYEYGVSESFKGVTIN